MARSTQDAETQVTQSAETPAEDPKAVKLTAKEAADQLPSEGLSGAQEFVQSAITRAASLIEAKHAIQADLQQSRDFLAFAAKGQDVTEAQSAWIADYLPKRNRATGETTEGE